MIGFKRDKKEEEDGGNPFSNMEKATVLQEAKTFNETPIVPRKCSHILTKILYLINQGESLQTREATETFFAMTKLFQSKDVALRRMVYLVIKEMSKLSEDVIIVTSSLTKDMTGKEDQFRGPAIRALCTITDATMLQSIERYMKQAIVDKNYSVASGALTSSLHLSRSSPDVVKRWVNEVQQAATSENIMVQYHALGLLYHIRKSDRLAVSKLVSKFSKHSLRSPHAYCLLIRIACRLLEEDESGMDSPMFEFIESCLRHKSEMVTYEAASAIVSLKNTTTKELGPAVSVLQLFCSSPRPTLRFAAVRTLNKVAMKHPAAVTACNLDLENLITDVNRSVATLAITTLLKTGSESSVDRLMKQISTFMSEISDEFKTVVVDAIRSLCLKFPRKHGVLMGFLANMLRDEGGFEYKKSIVDTIIRIVDENPEAKESGLGHLCEFIEDCEHQVLAVRILHMLGRDGPRTSNPARYIRYIYNRVILENETVRAAAVTALAKFGAHSEELLPSILVLLERCLLDTDDEVRDRATLYLRVLKEQQRALASQYILNGLQVSVVGLERALRAYSSESADAPFDMKTVPLDVQQTERPAERMPGEISTSKTPEKAAASRQDIYAEQLAAVPQISALGALFKSSSLPVELTEPETEYIVQCIKHTFPNHLVFQFDCTNTLNDQQLENVYVQMDSADDFHVLTTVRAPVLKYNAPATCYTIIQLSDDPMQVVGSFTCTLKFLVKDCDPNTGEPDDEGFDDEYVLEDLEVSVGDHVQKVQKTSFGAAWEEMGPENELEDTYQLSSMSSLPDAVKQISGFLGLGACERSDRVPEGKSTHVLLLAGVFRGGHDVLVRAQLALADGEVNMKMSVRSTDPSAAEVVASAVG